MKTTTFDFFSTSLQGSTLTPCKHPIRVVIMDGAPWFVAADVCNVLGLVWVSQALRPLGSDEQRLVTRATNRNLFPLGRGSSRLLLISESGLNKLIIRSDKPAAKPMQEWVTREVLPAIRRTGGYRLQGVAPPGAPGAHRGGRSGRIAQASDAHSEIVL